MINDCQGKLRDFQSNGKTKVDIKKVHSEFDHRTLELKKALQFYEH